MSPGTTTICRVRSACSRLPCLQVIAHPLSLAGGGGHLLLLRLRANPSIRTRTDEASPSLTCPLPLTLPGSRSTRPCRTLWPRLHHCVRLSQCRISSRSTWPRQTAPSSVTCSVWPTSPGRIRASPRALTADATCSPKWNSRKQHGPYFAMGHVPDFSTSTGRMPTAGLRRSWSRTSTAMSSPGTWRRDRRPQGHMASSVRFSRPTPGICTRPAASEACQPAGCCDASPGQQRQPGLTCTIASAGQPVAGADARGRRVPERRPGNGVVTATSAAHVVGETASPSPDPPARHRDVRVRVHRDPAAPASAA